MLITPHLKAYYPFDKLEDLLDFDGVDDYIDCGSDASLRIIGDRTLTAWVKLSAGTYPNAGTNWNIMLNESYQNYGFMWRIAGTAGRQVFRTSQAGASSTQLSSTSIGNNTLHFLCVVISSGTLTFYKDGVSDGGGLITAQVASSSDFHISNNGQAMDGLIDKPQIFSRALSLPEIQRCMKHPDAFISDANLEGYWKLDEGTGSTANDSSGNNNDGTITGASWVQGTWDDSGNRNLGTVHGASLTTGKFGKCYSFDGTDDYIDCGSGNSLDITGNEIALVVWIKAKASQGNYPGITCKGTVVAAATDSYFVRLETDRFLSGGIYTTSLVQTRGTITLNDVICRWYFGCRNSTDGKYQ